jgi:hypothetical protein
MPRLDRRRLIHLATAAALLVLGGLLVRSLVAPQAQPPPRRSRDAPAPRSARTTDRHPMPPTYDHTFTGDTSTSYLTSGVSLFPGDPTSPVASNGNGTSNVWRVTAGTLEGQGTGADFPTGVQGSTILWPTSLNLRDLRLEAYLGPQTQANYILNLVGRWQSSGSQFSCRVGIYGSIFVQLESYAGGALQSLPTTVDVNSGFVSTHYNKFVLDIDSQGSGGSSTNVTLKIYDLGTDGTASPTLVYQAHSNGVTSAGPLISGRWGFSCGSVGPGTDTPVRVYRVTATDLSAPVNAIALTRPQTGFIVQRSLSAPTTTIVITGTYTAPGTPPTAIEYQVDGGSWGTLVSSPTGGTFNSTISGLTAGAHVIAVRFDSDTSTTASANPLYIGNVFVLYGQSNMVGQFTNNQPFSADSPLAGRLWPQTGSPTAWVALADPVGADGHGSYIPHLATALVQGNHLPVGIIPCAHSGQAISGLLPGGTLYNDMKARVLVATGNLSGTVRAVLYHQGESDAGITDPEVYRTRLRTLAAGILADLGCPLVVCKLQQCSAAPTGGIDAINAIIESEWGVNNILRGPDYSNLPDDGDGAHLTTDAHAREAGGAWAYWIGRSLDATAATSSAVPRIGSSMIKGR